MKLCHALNIGANVAHAKGAATNGAGWGATSRFGIGKKDRVPSRLPYRRGRVLGREEGRSPASALGMTRWCTFDIAAIAPNVSVWPARLAMLELGWLDQGGGTSPCSTMSIGWHPRSGG